MQSRVCRTAVPQTAAPVSAVLCLLGELQDVAIAAVQGALGRGAVPALVLGAHRVNDETRSQVKSFRQLGLACPAT